MYSIIKKQKVILSTLFFEGYENRHKFFNILNTDDFTIEVYQKIYVSMKKIHQKKANIDEINIRAVLEDEKYFEELSQVIREEKVDISLLDDLINDLKDNSLETEIKALPNAMKTIIENSKKDKKSILSQTKKLLEKIEEKQKIEVLDASWKDALKHSKSLLTYEMLSNVEEAKALVEGFFFEQTLTVLHSKPGTGKTTLLLGLIKLMIDLGVIDEFIYFDADNPLSVLKDRLPKLEKTFGNKMTYHTHTSSSYELLKEEMKRLCLYKNQGKRVFVVVDTLGKFVKSVNDDKECKPFMDLLCDIRDIFGATVALVHHSNKNENDLGRPVFRGSTVISGDCDFMWGMKRKGEETTIYNDKGRLNYFEKINAFVELEDYSVDLEGSYDYKDSEDEEETKEVSYEKLKEFLHGKEWVSMTDIRKHFKATNRNRKGEKQRQDEIWDILQDNKDTLVWNGEHKNKAKYKFTKKDETPVEIVFENDFPTNLY